MLVKYGGGVLDATGSIGGQTHSRNRYGPYVRARTTPVNPRTDRQTAVRAAAAILATRWSTVLSIAQRTSWAQYAAAIIRSGSLGAQIKLTGFNHFVRSNLEAIVHSEAVLYDGPINLTLPDQIVPISAVIDEATQMIEVTFDNSGAWASQATANLFCYMSQPKTPGTSFIGGPWRFADVIDGEAPGPVASPVSIACPFVVSEGQTVKVAFRVREEDARISDRFFHQSLVTA